MKKLFFILLLALSSSLFTYCSAQFNKYFAFPDTNATWVETNWDESNACGDFYEVAYYNFDYYANGDTAVAGKMYIKIRASGGYYDVPACNVSSWQNYDVLECLLREDTVTKMVYASFSPNLGVDTLLYDYSLQVGDYLPPCYLSQLSDSNFVYSIDSVLIGSTYRKQFNIAQYKSAPTIDANIVEGIGSSLGLLESIPSWPNAYGGWLDCFTDSSVTITYYSYYPCTRFYLAIPTIQKPEAIISVNPNPNNGIFTVAVSHSPAGGYQTIEIYNALGQQIYTACLPQTTKGALNEINISNQPNGIYLYRVIANSGELMGEGKLVIQK